MYFWDCCTKVPPNIQLSSSRSDLKNELQNTQKNKKKNSQIVHKDEKRQQSQQNAKLKSSHQESTSQNPILQPQKQGSNVVNPLESQSTQLKSQEVKRQINQKQQFFIKIDAESNQVSQILQIYTIRKKAQLPKQQQSVPWKKPRKNKGLKNFGNACYVNSALQCLSHCGELTKRIGGKEKIFKDEPTKSLTYNLSSHYKAFLKQICDENSNLSAAMDIKSAVSKFNHHFADSQQKDSLEFVATFLEALNQELKEVIEENESNQFQRQLKHEINNFKKQKYSTSNNHPDPVVKHTNEVELILQTDTRTLPDQSKLKENQLNKKQINQSASEIDPGDVELRDQDLSKFYEQKYKKHNNSIITEMFSGQYKTTITCNQCENTSNSFRTFDSFSIIYLPIQLKGSYSQKHSLEMCLYDFCKSEQLKGQNSWFCKICDGDRPSTKTTGIYKTNQYLILGLKRFKDNIKINHFIDFDLDLNMRPFLINQAKNCNYSLFAVINHIGSLRGGHYYAFCKNENGFWFKFDDSRVKQISMNEVITSDAYAFFYRRNEENKKYV